MFRKLLLYFALLLWFVVPAKAQLTIMLPEMEVESGEVIDLDMRVTEFNAIIGAQWSIQWNPDILEYIKIKQVKIGLDFRIGRYRSSDFNHVTVCL